MYYCLLAVSQALPILSEPHNAAGPARKMVSEMLGHLAKRTPLLLLLLSLVSRVQLCATP